MSLPLLPVHWCAGLLVNLAPAGLLAGLLAGLAPAGLLAGLLVGLLADLLADLLAGLLVRRVHPAVGGRDQLPLAGWAIVLPQPGARPRVLCRDYQPGSMRRESRSPAGCRLCARAVGCPCLQRPWVHERWLRRVLRPTLLWVGLRRRFQPDLSRPRPLGRIATRLG